jgi:hypothetical protein
MVQVTLRTASHAATVACLRCGSERDLEWRAMRSTSAASSDVGGRPYGGDPPRELEYNLMPTEHLNRIANLLTPWADENRTLTQNSFVTAVKAHSAGAFESPAAAFEEALRFAASLTDGELVLANRVDIGVQNSPIGLTGPGWRAVVDVVLCEREHLAAEANAVAL